MIINSRKSIKVVITVFCGLNLELLQVELFVTTKFGQDVKGHIITADDAPKSC